MKILKFAKIIAVFAVVLVTIAITTSVYAFIEPIETKTKILIFETPPEETVPIETETDITSFYDLFEVDIDEIIENSYRNWTDQTFGKNTHIHNYRCGHTVEELPVINGVYINYADLEYYEEMIKERGNFMSEKRANEQLEFYTNASQYIKQNGISIEYITHNINLYKDNDLTIAYCINKCKNKSYRLSDLCTIECIRFCDGYGRYVEVH